MADTNFFLHFGLDGQNTVYHKAAKLPKSGLLVPIDEKSKKLVEQHDANALAYEGDKIVVKKAAAPVDKKKQYAMDWPWLLGAGLVGALSMKVLELL